MSRLVIGIILLLAAGGMYLVMNENHARFATITSAYTYTLVMTALAFIGAVAIIWSTVVII